MGGKRRGGKGKGRTSPVQILDLPLNGINLALFHISNECCPWKKVGDTFPFPHVSAPLHPKKKHW